MTTIFKLYSAYLLGKRKEIFEKWSAEKEAYHYHYPELSETAGKPVFAIEDKTTELDLQTNEYLEEGKRLKQKFGVIDKPQVVDLKKAHVGLVGEKSVIHEQLKLSVSQIAFAQSYHDVQFVVIYASGTKPIFPGCGGFPMERSKL